MGADHEEEDFWTLEVVDALGGSTVWDDEFSTDEEALEEAMAVTLGNLINHEL